MILKKVKIFNLEFTTNNISNISKYILANSPQQILPTSMADILLCHKNKEIFNKINNFSIKTMDGIPLVCLARQSTHQKISRGYGPNLMIQIFKDSQNTDTKHFLYGGTDIILEKLKKELFQIAPKSNIVDTFSPPFRELYNSEKEDLINKIKKSKSTIVWVGLGSIKQINFINEFKDIFPNITFLAVGAAFDFISKEKPQAPVWMQNIGLEWLYRFSKEPTRLFNRYIISLPTMIFLFLNESIRIKIGSCLKKY